MEKKDIKKITISELLVLCEIIDQFEEFNKKIINLITRDGKKDTSIILNLWNASIGNKYFLEETMEFYLENKKIIDIINNHMSIQIFIDNNYTNKGQLNDERLGFFYKYILNNKDNIEKIKELLKKIERLGFYELNFDETLDVKNKTYILHNEFYCNYGITYVDNIEVIPSYDKYLIKYKSISSNYEIVANFFSPYLISQVKKITINSLLFDKERLPEKIDMPTIVDPIKKQRDEKENEYACVHNSINLKIGIDELRHEVDNIKKTTMSKLDNVTNKKELVKILKKLNKEIKVLIEISENYDQNIISEYSSITDEVLETEKKAYMKRKEDNAV